MNPIIMLSMDAQTTIEQSPTGAPRGSAVIILDKASVVAVDCHTHEVLEVGHAAQAAVSPAPAAVELVRPGSPSVFRRHR